ncbi:MAG: extracellular solute-binding protein [Anaerolineae bacterium]|nr:extracellular solute-binding protein [Anaerolineae bacterium]
MQIFKIIRFALVALVLTGALAIAYAQDEPQYAGLDMDLSGITIRMATIGGGQYEAMYDSIAVFEAETGATVEIVALLDGFAIDQKLKLDFATGAADYDVAWDHTSFVAQYTDYLLPLNGFFTAEELAPFSPAILEAATIDGNLYLIPRHADVSALHYRTDLYENADIAAAYLAATGNELAVPTTLDEVDAQGRFFVENGYSNYGYTLSGKEEALTGRFYEMLFASGGALFDENYEPVFNNEIGVAVAELLTGWYNDGIIPPDTTSLLWDGDAAYWCNSETALKLEWYGWYSYFQNPESCAVAGHFGLARGFSGLSIGGDAVRPTGWAGAHAFSIPATAPNPEAGAQLIKFLTSERVAYEEAQLGFLPTRDDVWERVIADASGSSVPLDAQRLELARLQVSEDFKTPPLIAEWIPFSNIFYPHLQAVILGDVSAQEGLDMAVEETRAMMADAGYYD